MQAGLRFFSFLSILSMGLLFSGCDKQEDSDEKCSPNHSEKVAPSDHKSEMDFGPDPFDS